ncbi:cysteine desulfurase [Candidatus Azambacteria bacterium]|nr:cysteine desulfurase [Candidatus Azambacteria bacterium]
MPLDSQKIKKDFPVFTAHKTLVYLDSAATTQKPREVIDALTRHYRTKNANIKRGIYSLSEQATEAYEEARWKVARFCGAPCAKQIIFTKNATEAINCVAHSFARARFTRGDEILLTVMEHHSNIVPWQMIAKEKGLKLRFVSVTKNGELDMRDLKKKVTRRTKLFAVTHASNVLGTINPVKKLVAFFHARGIPVLVDGAQAIGHMPVNVGAFGCDFYVFSGHKMFAPTGIGALYVHQKYLDTLPPFLGGGDMVLSVSETGATFQDAPERFEAGTPPIEAAVALGAATDYCNTLGMENIRRHETELTAYALKKLARIPGISVFGPKSAAHRTGVIAFAFDDIHPHDLASLLDEKNIAIRAGHHCAMPLHRFLDVTASARASFSVYNTKKDVDALYAALAEITKALHARHEH